MPKTVGDWLDDHRQPLNDFPSVEEMKSRSTHRFWTPIAEHDVEVLIEKDSHYQGSWKKRGGVGAFMMLARKWDRIEARMQDPNINYDIFKALEEEVRQEGILDDIQDLRRYLLLVEAEINERKASGQVTED